MAKTQTGESVPKKQLSIRLGSGLEQAIANSSRTKSKRINDLADRYWWLIDGAMPSFSDVEWEVILSIGPTLKLSPPAHALPRLPYEIEYAISKNQDVGKDFIEKLKSLDHLGLVALAEKIEAEKSKM